MSSSVIRVRIIHFRYKDRNEEDADDSKSEPEMTLRKSPKFVLDSRTQIFYFVYND